MNRATPLAMISPQQEPRNHADSPSSAIACKEELPSFELLVQQHQAKIYNFIYRYTRNREDAEDLVQDTFVKAFRFLHRYDSKYPFASWLFTIARRTVYNHYRSSKTTESIEFDIVDQASTPDKMAEQADTKDSIWTLAKQLKADQQEVLVLKYSDDLSVKEIALIMNKSATNIKILLFRARNQLKKLHSKQTDKK
tara:strand:+ start:649 stop:1236 length:588 start_codon:yes stop_codon:yes gene_type:complete